MSEKIHILLNAEVFFFFIEHILSVQNNIYFKSYEKTIY